MIVPSTKQLRFFFFLYQTSVAKGQGDVYGEASKEKDTGLKNERSWEVLLSVIPPPSKRSIDFHKKDSTQFLSGEYSQTI